MTRRLVILVTGSRVYAEPGRMATGRKLIGDALAQAVRDAVADAVVVRHGCCRGADMIADEWARAMQRLGRNVEIDGKPADWDRYGKAAGFIRNAQMVTAGADTCLAFPVGTSPGTRDCITRAQEAGIPVRIYEGAA